MKSRYNIHEAKTQFSKLVERAESGEEIVIARHGRPVAELSPHRPGREPRTLGLLKGKIWVSDDFDDPLPSEIQRYFEGEDDGAS